MTELKVHFWGTRGSIAAPGAKTLRYGGNTSCVEIRSGEDILICDSGTGIRECGLSLLKEFGKKPMDLALFIGHTHWDHIQGFPFFVPAYFAQNKIKVHSVKSVGDTFENIIRGQMGMNYFPVEVGDMMAQIDFQHTRPTFQVRGVEVSTMYTNHPGVNVCFRFHFPGGKTIVYLSDHENHQAFGGANKLMARQDKMVEDFCRGADLLIADSQYTENDYKIKKGWGHSRWRDTLELGMSAEVKRLALYHHDPERTDDAIDEIVAECRAIIQDAGKTMDCFGASESCEVFL